MTKILSRIFPLLILCICSCKDKSPVLNIKDQLTNGITVQRFNGGHKINEYNIASNAPVLVQLSEWITNNTTGWKRSYTSYVPEVVIRGSSFSLNFLSGKVVLNAWDETVPNGQFVLEKPKLYPTFVTSIERYTPTIEETVPTK